MNIEQLSLAIEQNITPWDDIRECTEKYSRTTLKSTNPQDLAAEMFSAALGKAISGKSITTDQSSISVYYLEGMIFVKIDIWEHIAGYPKHKGAAIFTSEDGETFTKTLAVKKHLSLQFLNNRFIINDHDGLYYSKSGYNWDYVSSDDISEDCSYLRDVTHDGKKYVVLFDDSDDNQYIAVAKKIKSSWEAIELDVDDECSTIAFSNDTYYLEGENEDGTCVVYTSDDAEYWFQADEDDASDPDDVEIGDWFIEEDEDDDNLYLSRKRAEYDPHRIYDENIFFFVEKENEIWAKQLPKGKKYKIADAPFDVTAMFFHNEKLLLFGTHLEYAVAEVISE